MNNTYPVLLELIHRMQDRLQGRGGTRRMLDAMIQHGLIGRRTDIGIDHIVIRTLAAPYTGIDTTEKIFLHLGYTKRESWYIPGSKLNAQWYAPPRPIFPRLLLTEASTQDLPPEARMILSKYTEDIRVDPIQMLNMGDAGAIDRYVNTGPWTAPSLRNERDLLGDTEEVRDFLILKASHAYAAKVLYKRCYLNYFAIAVQYLPRGYNTLKKFHRFLEKNGYDVKGAGTTIHRSYDGLLLQSASAADRYKTIWEERNAGYLRDAYVEFVERRPLPAFRRLRLPELKREHLRDGFDLGNMEGLTKVML